MMIKKFVSLGIIAVCVSFLLSVCKGKNQMLLNSFLLSEFDDKETNIGYEEAMMEYEGYLDNIQLLHDEFADQDYDEDGLKDRVLQYFTEENKKMYAICFGNGNILEMGPFIDNFTGIELYAVDLTGDGSNEIIFCGKHMGSTNPMSGSEIAVWTRKGNIYTQMPLPYYKSNGIEENYYSTGYPFYVKLTDEEYTVIFTCPELDYIKKYQIPLKWRSEFTQYYSYLQKGETELTSSNAWSVSIVNDGESSFLNLSIGCLNRLPVNAKIKLRWNGKEFEVMDITISDY